MARLPEQAPFHHSATFVTAPETGMAEENDRRSWWFCGANTWVGHYLAEAPTARQALAQYRHALIEGERSAGRSRRDAEEIARIAGLHIIDGPLSTPVAREREFGWALAWAICDKSSLRIDPRSPATPADAAVWLTDREIQTLRTNVDRVFALNR